MSAAALEHTPPEHGAQTDDAKRPVDGAEPRWQSNPRHVRMCWLGQTADVITHTVSDPVEAQPVHMPLEAPAGKDARRQRQCLTRTATQLADRRLIDVTLKRRRDADMKEIAGERQAGGSAAHRTRPLSH